MGVNLANIKRSYKYAMAEAGTTVDLLINNGPGSWDTYPGIPALPRKFAAHELVPPLQQNDVKLIILAEDMPAGVTRLKTRDRVRIEGREYTVEIGDYFSRQVKGVTVAVESVVRG
jgi:hypothetical protein